ncbi:uncharacterized protein LOC110118783 isoform X2 [Ceratitis capitata]|uniref:uncharacterized protein LOC110118783 isoform X2 n=1 Tax=Ceratitis capitata TaxID=7213 RepID=UPI000A1108CC|nr:uncharacterized protein LOC110118783 isoform X2 [Ceratitis capitata]
MCSNSQTAMLQIYIQMWISSCVWRTKYTYYELKPFQSKKAASLLAKNSEIQILAGLSWGHLLTLKRVRHGQKKMVITWCQARTLRLEIRDDFLNLNALISRPILITTRSLQLLL